MNFIKNIFILLYISNSIFSQIDESWKVYDDSNVAIIKISMDPADLQFMYDNPDPENDSLHLAQVHFKNSQIDDVIDSVGIRIRGNTSRFSSKKSFKLSFNTFIKGRKFYSLEKLNLNGEHNDPSIARSKISWDFFNYMGVTSSKATHAAVYINDVYQGLYISVEHIDENFIAKRFYDDSGNLWKCLYGADLNFISTNPDNYKMGGIKRVYDLKTNVEQDNYSKLSELIDFLNNSDDEMFRSQLSQKIDIASLLQVFAINVVTGMWDDYWANTNNYYLYHEPSIDKFYVIPYDYDNTFGIDWFGIDWANVNPYTFDKINQGYRPLIERTLSFPEFHNLFTRFLYSYVDQRNSTSLSGNKINDLKNKIISWAEIDSFRTMDYGFTIDQFNDSFLKTDFSQFHVKSSINTFINERFNSLNSQLFYKDAHPLIYDFHISSIYLENSDPLSINCSVYSNLGIKSVDAEFINSSTGDTLNYPLTFSPNLESQNIIEQDRWTVDVAETSNGYNGSLQIIIEDSNGVVLRFPNDRIELRSAGEVTNEVLLSELMSSNSTTIADEANEYDDWLEIYNPQENAVFLSGMYLTDKISNLRKWQFPQNVIVQPKQSVLIWCDEDVSQAALHVNFKLSSKGEFLAIVDTDGITIVDSVTFPVLADDLSYARESDKGNWFVTNSSTPGTSNILTNLASQDNVTYKYNLSAYPNPFNPSTVVEYELAKSMNLEFNIFDILGREIWKSEKKIKEMGKHSLTWNGTDKNGNELSSGIYLLNLNGKDFRKSIKLMLVR